MRPQQQQQQSRPRAGTWETETVGFTVAEAVDQAEIPKLHAMCDQAKEDNQWDEIREWLRRNRANVLVAGAETLGDYNTTPLHLACRNCPPIDIVEQLLSVAPHTVRIEDSFSWLPLHYACANGASYEVLQVLVDAFPESRTASDKRGRTPLHFALGNTQRPASPQVVELLVQSGAAALCPDENGMLPLHYACAYGISKEALAVLTAASTESITATDTKGRTPLHFAMGNADRAASPAVVQHLLKANVSIVNLADKDGLTPLNLLSTQANRLEKSDQKAECNNAKKCLELYLKASPHASSDFFTALQSLPEFLREQAVVTPYVQDVINYKISNRFPTMILMLDFLFIVAILVSFEKAVAIYTDYLFDSSVDNRGSEYWIWIACLYVGAAYFCIREVVQMISMASQNMFQTWLLDPANLLDCACIIINFFWAAIMTMDPSWIHRNKEVFRSGTAVCSGILYLLVLSYLKSTLIDFAVFVNGVFYVVRRLIAFLMALLIILVAFAQMFVTVFRGTSLCVSPSDPPFPFCSFGTSLLELYTMMLGNVDASMFNNPDAGSAAPMAIFLFVLFMFLVVILLANVLIAIVTDSYQVIRNQRAQTVFWNSRLDYVAEMDLISSGPWISKFKKAFCCGGGSSLSDHEDFGSIFWKNVTSLYDDQDLHIMSAEFWCYLLFRAGGVIVIIVWIVCGIVTMGFLWPRQVRDRLFIQRTAKQSKGDSLAEQRLYQMNELKAEVKKLQVEIKEEMAADRKEMDGMKAQMAHMKSEMTSEMKAIKEIMTMLYDLQSSADI